MNNASAQPGSATGTSTPFATVNVSPFLWCVRDDPARVVVVVVVVVSSIGRHLERKRQRSSFFVDDAS